ncbi:hypothetical protein ACSVDE_10010 [Pseudalkalibacillus sp. Hm43]|uniref:hypothetical protein n=1 Tax=Pseudalkalibacillus sp. Hm43 TaxID=3450742 RepID=UPI003F439518
MLEAIIELLMQNIFFVILIIGGIYSFFKRQIEQQKEEQQRGRPRPNQQQPNTSRAETMSMPKEEPVRPSRPERPRSERIKKVENNLQEMYEAKRLELQDAFQGSSEQVPAEEPVRKRAKARKEVIYKERPKNKIIPDPDNVAQGVIWAEILGPPRSRKPHHLASRFNRR